MHAAEYRGDFVSVGIDAIKKKLMTLCKLLLTFDVKGIASRVRQNYALLGRSSGLTREQFLCRAQESLDQFFYSGAKIGLDTVQDSEVTIVLVLWNKAELTYQCLQSLTAISSRHVRFSVLIIDNASSDVTKDLLRRVDGADIVWNTENVGFLKACNQARDLVRSPYLLFLNNDTIVHHGALEAAMEQIRGRDDVGAVGARIILPSGKLQEAGNIIWNDGTCQGYARGRPATAPEAMFRRYTDYCSGAFLLTRTELFKRFGGFDERYLPAYYEETDYCVSLWRSGYKIVYEPRAAITHFEFGSAELSSRAFELMSANRIKFLEKHKEYLAKKPSPVGPPACVDEFRIPEEFRAAKRILYIEDRIPNKFLGAGFPRSNTTLKALAELGYFVTVFPTHAQPHAWNDAYGDIDPGIEIMRGFGMDQLEDFLRSRVGFYDLVWVCRPDNLEFIVKYREKLFGGQKLPVVYDGEAIFSDREKAYVAVKGHHSKSKWRTNEQEFALARNADVVVAVSESEAAKWRAGTSKPAFVIGHEYHLNPTTKKFADRRDFLFVGAFHGNDSPNGDSIEWFLENVMPLIKAKLGLEVKLTLVGHSERGKWNLLQDHAADLNVVGRVGDLYEAYDHARVVIIPTRFASGIPQKAFDAAEHAVPVVCTDLIADQMGWMHQKEALVSPVGNAEQFAEHCVRLYSDQALWEEIRASGVSFFKKRSQAYDMKRNITDCLGGVEALGHRK